MPPEWLEADIKQGITNADVEARRKRFGWNEITTEKENLFLKFLGFFTGPILYGTFSLYCIRRPDEYFSHLAMAMARGKECARLGCVARCFFPAA